MSDTLQFPSQDALLDISVVKAILDDLSAAFPGGARAKNIETMLRTYRNNLAGISEAAARGAAKAIIRGDERFPSVSRLRAAAHEWTRRNTASPEYQLRHDPNMCQSCRSPFETRKRWRPAKSENGKFLLTPDRASVLLETYNRDVCSCHAPSKYAPHEQTRWFNGVEYATMPKHLLPPNDQRLVDEQLASVRAPWRPPHPEPPIGDTVQQEAQRLIAVGGAR